MRRAGEGEKRGRIQRGALQRKRTFLPKMSPSGALLVTVIRNNIMLNCQGVTTEDGDLKRASTPQPVVITEEMCDTKRGGSTSSERSGCNEDGVTRRGDPQNLDGVLFQAVSCCR